ncbi:RNA polymerase sigma factor [Parasphingorhabdus sp. JC815]|uniref:RNA polymerase sigma factor n=1 Tax=Parasphingorhabdus sp. JC815 TaxID=3232140 RepID=UPI0034594F9C
MAFEQDLMELLPRLRRFSRSLTRNIDDADDLCQMAIERALLKRDQWQSGTRLDSWMYRITRNIWIDTVRSAGRREHTANDDHAMENVAGDDHQRMEARMELTDVDRAMEELPMEQREAVSLVLVEGFAYKEAADLLDIPIGTLTSRLVRGREALQRALGEAA